MYSNKKIGLALSGGGALGVHYKLNILLTIVYFWLRDYCAIIARLF